MRSKPRFIDEQMVFKILTPRIANHLVAKGFRNNIPSKVQLPPKVYLTVPKGDYRAMPVFRLGGSVAGIKWVSVFPGNAERGLPIVNGTMLLSDAESGVLNMVMEANTLTALRTGAAGAIASKHMACSRPGVLALIGAGVQSEYQLKCHIEIFDLDQVRVWAPSFKQAENFARRFRTFHRGLKASPSIRECVRDADIISTCTPSRRVLVRAGWVKPGAHINAMGADAIGKRELETRLLKKARLFVDDWVQASHSGEINVPLSRGEIRKKHILGSLTDIVLKKLKSRVSAKDITVFDSTGLAIQDLMLAEYLYKRLHRRA